MINLEETINRLWIRTIRAENVMTVIFSSEIEKSAKILMISEMI